MKFGLTEGVVVGTGGNWEAMREWGWRVKAKNVPDELRGLEKRTYIPESELDSKNEVICLECQLEAGRKSCVALIAAHRQGSFGANAMRECAVKQDKPLQRQTVDSWMNKTTASGYLSVP